MPGLPEPPAGGSQGGSSGAGGALSSAEHLPQLSWVATQVRLS
jgi:hypothetical protein